MFVPPHIMTALNTMADPRASGMTSFTSSNCQGMTGPQGPQGIAGPTKCTYLSFDEERRKVIIDPTDPRLFDFSYVLKMLNRTENVFKYASKELQNDKMLCLIALKYNRDNYKYMSLELQHDSDIVNCYLNLMINITDFGDNETMLETVKTHFSANITVLTSLYFLLIRSKAYSKKIQLWKTLGFENDTDLEEKVVTHVADVDIIKDVKWLMLSEKLTFSVALQELEEHPVKRKFVDKKIDSNFTFKFN